MCQWHRDFTSWTFGHTPWLPMYKMICLVNSCTHLTHVTSYPTLWHSPSADNHMTRSKEFTTQVYIIHQPLLGILVLCLVSFYTWSTPPGFNNSELSDSRNCDRTSSMNLFNVFPTLFYSWYKCLYNYRYIYSQFSIACLVESYLVNVCKMQELGVIFCQHLHPWCSWQSCYSVFM